MFSKQPTKSDLTNKTAMRMDTPMLAPSDSGQARKAPSVASLISENLTIEGGITGEGELHIDGIVRGDVRIGKLTIGDTGHVEGSIFAEAVEARGRVIGAITAKQVRLYGTCYIDGDITHEQLAMETGAFFQGRSLKFQRPPAPPAETTAKPAQAVLEAPVASSAAPEAKPAY
jgi:cytoskeletal protein CcmA (bactofilin family)